MRWLTIPVQPVWELALFLAAVGISLGGYGAVRLRNDGELRRLDLICNFDRRQALREVAG